MTATLHPFFSFFGSKWRLARLYPAPETPVIVEPFAGSGGYSLRYPEREVRLFDKDPVIVGVWQYLIGVSEKELTALPDVHRGQTVEDFAIPQEAKHLIGFWITESQTYPSTSHLSPSRDGSWSARKRRVLAGQLEAIRHWKAEESSYDAIDLGGRATWFVDPPYFGAGKRYKFGNKGIDYSALGDWCRSRQGQVIVCEGTGADWLPFLPLVEQMNGSNKPYAEVVWRQSSPLPGSPAALRKAGLLPPTVRGKVSL